MTSVGSAASVERNWEDLDVFAPEFRRVTVEGRELDPSTKGDVLDIQVVLDLNGPAAFTLNVSDWDDEAMTFKYSSSTAFDPGREVSVELGYADRLVHMITGQISSLSARFPESGAPTLAVSGQDRLRELANRKPKAREQKQFPNVRDYEVAQQIAKRLGMDAVVTKKGPLQPLVVIKNQDYASFLVERARRIDFEVYVAHDPQKKRPALYFVERRDGRDAEAVTVYRFTYGANLISFTPRLSTTKQVRTVTVRGWDPEKKQPIVFTADRSHLPKPAAGENSGAAKAVDGTGDIHVDAPVKSLDEARAYAVSLLMERANQFLTGTGRTVGLPDLRPGNSLELDGIGARFNGRYQIVKVTHTLGSSGYTTEFEVSRANQGDVTAAQKSNAAGAAKR